MSKEKDQSIQTNKSDVEVWDVADLVTVCGQCDTVTKVFTVEGGTQFIMTTRSDAAIKLTCPNCKNEMTLTFRNGRAFTDAELEEKKKDKLDKKEKDEPQKDSSK